MRSEGTCSELAANWATQDLGLNDDLGGSCGVLMALETNSGEGIESAVPRELKGKLGEGHSDIFRAIIMNWLGEQGYLAKGGKHA